MIDQTMPHDPHALRVFEARRKFFDQGYGDEGDERDHPDCKLPHAVLRSWQRCLESGLDYRADGRGDPEGRSELAAARERSERLLRNASGVMEHVFDQIRASGSMVILADDHGMILHSLGDPEFFTRAQRVALQPGSLWSESMRGTNAIGTTLMEAGPVEVIGAEHFLDRNSILTCSAAPVFDPEGKLLGVFDISADYRNNQRHTLGLARLAAQLIEKHLFEVEFSSDILVAFHLRPEGVGSLQEGVLAVSAEGRILGANLAGRALFAESNGLVGLDFNALFKPSFGHFVDRGSRPPFLQTIETRHGERLYARLRSAPSLRSNPPARGTSNAAADRMAFCDARHEQRVTLKCLATGDPSLQTALDRASRIMGKDIPLLIQGESGVGKELFARAFHYSGPRQDGPFVALNCAAIPENLIESELFGYVGGAFTGARREGSIGKIQQAHGGTLFLDEIGDMPLNMQARLLRVLQERCVTPVGAQRQVPVDISLVCATHRVLREAMRAGSFREDLYYRINGLTVTLPALRERSDIRSIVHKLIAAEASDGVQVTISEPVMDFFERYPWPGNVRQLQNVIRLAVALLDEGETEIQSCHLPEDLFSADQMGETKSGQEPAFLVEASGRSLDEIKCEAIAMVMNEFGGNVSAAARRLGISRNTLYRKIGRMN